jgi:pyridoxamine 5'-phosphate oxidase
MGLDDLPSFMRFRSTDRARAWMIPPVNIGSAAKSAALETPLQTLGKWLEEARSAGAPDPEAMALATVGADGRPSVRFVLCRGIDEQGVRFFTSYESRKGQELARSPLAAVVFHWPVTRHQVRIEGKVTLLSAAESDAYFHSRARGSQLSASVSPQSAPIADLDGLREQKRRLDERLQGGEVPRPASWGGYLLRADSVELWTSGADRLHDRVLYERQGVAWTSRRLAP